MLFQHFLSSKENKMYVEIIADYHQGNIFLEVLLLWVELFIGMGFLYNPNVLETSLRVTCFFYLFGKYFVSI